MASNNPAPQTLTTHDSPSNPGSSRFSGPIRVQIEEGEVYRLKPAEIGLGLDDGFENDQLNQVLEFDLESASSSDDCFAASCIDNLESTPVCIDVNEFRKSANNNQLDPLTQY
jgi:hypothetical protein